MPTTTTTTTTKPLRILCFGNSLTCGYPEGNPYANKLKERLEEELNAPNSTSTSTSTSNDSGSKRPIHSSSPGGQGAAGKAVKGGRGTKGRKTVVVEVECEVEGVPGDLVTKGTYLKRMEDSWAGQSYDWTIVLGGTNDLGWGMPEDKIIEGLKQAWDIPLSRGSKVLALTIPDTKYTGGDLPERRKVVNAAIREYKKRNFFHFDLFAALPHHGMPADERAANWMEDGLHLTSAGYDLMGRHVADALVRIIRLAEAQDTDISSIVTDARQRRAIEDLIFEEERGDPKLLSQGYIVVRRKDLD